MGSSGVGKTSILSRYVYNTYTEGFWWTIGIDFLYKNEEVDDKEISLQVWDLAGSERFRPTN